MSYGMHDYLAEKAMQNYGMRKYANSLAEQAAWNDPRTTLEGMPSAEEEAKKRRDEEDARYKEADESVRAQDAEEEAERDAALTRSAYTANAFGIPHPLRTTTANLNKSKAELNNAIHGVTPDYLRDKRGLLEKGYSRVRDWVAANPALAMDMFGFTGGATIGASLYKKNRLLGGAAGGIAGLLATSLGRRLYNEYKA